MQHYINGALTSEVTDEDAAHRRLSRLQGVRVHFGPPMRVGNRNWRLREF